MGRMIAPTPFTASRLTSLRNLSGFCTTREPRSRLLEHRLNTDLFRSYSFSRKGKEHWLTILKLATQWQFHEIRNFAIRQLERLNLQPIEKIALYKEYKINPDLLLPSYTTLCRNEKLPSPDEGRKLSLDTVLRLASARENMLLAAMESGCKTPTTASTPDDVTRSIIAELFELNLHSNDQTVTGMEGQAVHNGNALGNFVVDETVTVKPPSKKAKAPSAEPPAQNGPLLVGQCNLMTAVADSE